MLTRQQKAEQLRTELTPYIESKGVEQQMECRDGTTRRYREARIGGFLLRSETPFHRNPKPIATCWDEALYLQANPVEDYVLTVLFCDPAKEKQTTLFSGCWQSKGQAIHILCFAGNESRWYDILLVAVELSTRATRSETRDDHPTQYQPAQVAAAPVEQALRKLGILN
ncbi:MAG TPA: hypothetical protein VGH23_02450 [Rhizomicrobium sp.]|jgi:hypothetical protein